MKEPWYKDKATGRRLSRRFLSPPTPYRFPWGYIIYRTVYTPESELWPIAMEKLTQSINAEIERKLNNPRKRYGEDVQSS